MTAPIDSQEALPLGVWSFAEEYPQNIALSCVEGALTYRELAHEVERHRSVLENASAPVALVALPHLEALSLLHACFSFGRTVLLVPPAAPAALRKHLVEQTGASLCFSEDGWSQYSPPNEVPLPNPDDHVLLPTSGTTGEPKIVCLSQQALAASAVASNALVQANATSRSALSLPYAHIGGLSILVRAALIGASVIAKEFPLRTQESVAELESDAITHLSLVPTQLQRALETGSGCPRTLRAILVGGASCPAGLRARARGAGWPVVSTYGFTEAASQVCTQRLGREPNSKVERDVGRPLPGTEVALDGAGRISVRGPTMMNRYWGTAPRPSDQWFVTQDFGYWDDEDRLVIQGRADNVVISGGENVAAERVEESLVTLPFIRDAVVFGLEDEKWGQRIVALLVGEARPVEEIRQALREHLEPYALPKSAYFCEALPRLESGKLDRQQARQLLLKLHAAAIDEGADSGRVPS